MTAIGEAVDYVVLIQDCTDSVTAFTPSAPIIAELNYSSLNWSRRQNDVSKASCVVPVDCVDVPLKGWDYVMGVYRNGEVQWSGPITGWTVSKSGQLEIAASDIFAWAKKRFVYQDTDLSDVDLWAYLTELFSDLQASHSEYAPWAYLNPGNVHPGSTFGLDVSVALKASELRRVYDVMNDFVEAYGLFFTALPASAWYDDAALELAVPLSDHDIYGDPSITVDCEGTARTLYLASDQAGSHGYQTTEAVFLSPSVVPPYTEFVQETVSEQPPQASDTSSSFELKAAKLRALADVLYPKVAIEKVTLAPSFGGGVSGFNGMNTLIPGLTVRWSVADLDLDIPSAVVRASNRNNRTDILTDPTEYLTIGTSQIVRLTEVDVSVSLAEDGMTEDVTVQFVPWAEES